jgi:hypothetical protein
MRGILVLLGEAFRGGGQHCRSIGSTHSLVGQIGAADSHLVFIKYLEDNYSCDINVYIGTYLTKYNNALMEKYKQYIISSDFYEGRIGFNNLLINAIKKIDNISSYDFVLVMRIDLYLKPHFNTIFDPKWQTIHFPTILWATLPCGNPKTNDMMIFIPSKYYKYIDKITFRRGPNIASAIHGHYIWSDLVKNTDLTKNDLDAMIDTFHDSDSKKEYNPLYYVVNREICKIHKNPGYKFDKNVHPERLPMDKQQVAYKCKKNGCIYIRHTNILNNGGLYCCRSCRDGLGHGLLCEKCVSKN